MALSFPNIGHSWSENWLFKFANDNSTPSLPDYLYLAFQDETYSGDYYKGVILNIPSIRESINLAKSTAKTGNISITIADYDYNGSPISEELFGGSNHYINQEVTIHSRVNSETPIQIGTYRLTDISTNGTKIRLSMITKTPWDFIETPNVLSPTEIYAPISYGVFTGDSGINFYQNYTNTNYRPALFDSQTDVLSKLYYVTGVRASSGDAYPVLYSKNYDAFIPYRNGSANTGTLGNVETVNIQSNGRYSYYAGATSLNTGSTDIDITVANLSQIYNYNLANGGTFDYDKTDQVIEDNENSYVFNFSKTTSGATLKLKYSIDIDVIEHGSMYVAIDLTSDGGNISTGNKTSSVSTTTASVGLSEEIESARLTINFHHGAGLLPARLDATVTIYEAYIDYDVFVDEADIEEVYVGIDGDDKGYTSGTVTLIHEAHRALLNDYTNLDITGTPDGWTNLNTDRSGWTIRWWEQEPQELKKLLEKLQYEGCFIFKFKADGSPQYIHITDSPTADYTLTKKDIKDFSVKHTPLSQLLTKMELSYDKHPAENKYRSTATEQDSTARTNWNIEAKENTRQVKLDALVGNVASDFDDDPNDGFVSYYANISGDIKLQVSGRVINPDLYNIEVGDIVDFSDMHPEKAFGQSWSGKNFMITSIGRTVGTLKFEGREI